MPFEPKIVRHSDVPLEAGSDAWTDDEFDARLPEGLGALAAQLRDDAAQLSSVYPARIPTEDKIFATTTVAAPRRAAWLWISAGTLAAVSLSLLVALPWLLRNELPNFTSAENSPNTLAADDDRDVAAEPRAEANRLAAAPDSYDSREAPRSSAGALPAIFLQNVSGPELEGLFDLWEADEVEQSRISI